MKLLDLFCGAGGAAMGYHRAGFDEIVGVDIVPQKNYPFTFIQGDALQPPVRLEDFDLIHASPPCQAFSPMTADRSLHPDLIGPTRALLRYTPHVIENVRNARLAGHAMLCGSMFGLQVQRHRYFELSFLAWSPGVCNHASWDRPWTITGDLTHTDQQYPHSWKPSLARAKQLMEMPWIKTKREITESIPPAYTEYLGRQFLDQLGRVA